MKKQFFSMLMLLTAVFFLAGTASALTVDLLDLFDTNKDEVVKFGDGFGSIPPDLDHYNLSSVTRSFDLAQSPLLPGNFTVFVDFYGDDPAASNYFTINGTAFTLPNGDGYTTFTGNNELLSTTNAIIFNIDVVSGSNLDDFWVTDFYLTYDPTEQSNSPTPEPSTMLLLGVGIVGLAGTIRKKIKK